MFLAYENLRENKMKLIVEREFIMRRIYALVLVFVMLLSLVACSSEEKETTKQESTSTEDAPSDTSETNQSEEWSGETTKIIMTYLTMGETPADLQEIQDAVNEISIAKVGVEVEFMAMSAYEAMSQFPLMIGGGDQIDLMMLLLQDVVQYVDQGLIDPIDGLVEENAPYIQELLGKFPLADGTYVEGQMYGLAPVPAGYGNSGGFVVVSEYADATGFDFDPDKVYTMDELTELLRAIKEKYPEMYPNVTTPLTTGGSLISGADVIIDPLGGPVASGVLIGTDSTEVVNLFATQEYEYFARLMRQWQEEGLSYPDAATTSSPQNELIQSGLGQAILWVDIRSLVAI
jgi:putative aldouronate transport system substrate-binding protein